jgi:hypothetical protein
VQRHGITFLLIATRLPLAFSSRRTFMFRDVWAYVVTLARLSLGWWGVGRNVSLLLLSFVVLFLGLTAGLEVGFTEYAGQLWLRVLAIAFLFLFLVVAPYRLWLVQSREIASLDGRIHAAIVAPGQVTPLERKRRQEKADGYRLLLERANALRDRPITSPEELAQLEGDIDAWCNDTTDFVLTSDGHTQARHFRAGFLLTDSPLRPYPKGFNSNHSSRLAVLGVYQERVQALYDSARDRLS